MRKFVAGLTLLPALALLASCGGGGSKVTNSAVSAADPKEALAASSEVMSKENYYLEYRMEFPDGEGTYVIARRETDFVLSINADELGEFSLFQVGGKDIWCFGSEAGIGSLFGAEEDVCFDFSSEADEESEDGDLVPEDVFDEMLFNPLEGLLEDADDADVTVTDADDREIAGQDARCFDVRNPDGNAVICVSKESGVLMLVDGDIEGEEGFMELTSSRDPKDSDFEPPYEIQDFDELGVIFGGLDDLDSSDPKQPDDPGIDAVRIAGTPYPWESGAPLCPDIDLNDDWAVLGIEPLPGGAFALGDRQFDSSCAESVLEEPYNVRTMDGDGNIYISEYTGQIVRVGRDGSRTPVAGVDCGFGCTFSEDSVTEGPALEVEISLLSAMAVSDGTLWFAADDQTTEDMDYQIRRVTDDGRVESVPSPERDKDDNWISDLLPGPGGTLYVVYWDQVFHRAADGKYVEVEDIGDSCYTAQRWHPLERRLDGRRTRGAVAERGP